MQGSRVLSSLLLMPLVALGIVACATSHPTDLPTGNLQDTLKVLAERNHVCGVAVAVVKHRKLASIEYATGCPHTATPNADSVFQAASLSKPVFAYAVLKLAAQGKMDLDAPVVSYLPQGYRHQFAPLKAEPSDLVTDPRLGAITIRMVLNHTSGLPNWASGPLTFDATPPSAWRYSGEGYLLLQRAVEAVTRQPLDQFMTSQVFTPLGMHHSDYLWNEKLAQNLLPGTKANGSPRSTMKSTRPVAAFSLYTTAADYGKFLVHVLNDDALLQQSSASPVSVDPGLGLSWGLGWGMERAQDDPHIWHWGNNPGYRAFVIASARSGNGFVMLTNGENGLKLAQPIAQKILPGEHKLFQFPVLDDDLINLFCNKVRLCF